MPIGEPSHSPAPKSGCTVLSAPMVLTYAAELGCSGSSSTRVFQMWSAGNTAQLPSEGAESGESLSVEGAEPQATSALTTTTRRAQRLDGNDMGRWYAHGAQSPKAVDGTP